MRIIAGEARGRTIEAPAGRNTRPTLDRVRENLFNILQRDIPDSRVLDLFAGSGALSLEALSRGAANAVLVDSDRKACIIQRKNIEALRYTGRTKQYHTDWRKAVAILKDEKAVFDLVFLDPPYVMTDVFDILNALEPLLHDESLVVLEHEAGKETRTPEGYKRIKSRTWGYCAVSVFRLSQKGGED